MDPNAVVLEISSDEEIGWDSHDNRSITGDPDDHTWIAELLDEFNRDDCSYHDGSDDSDEVVLVSEVLPPRRPKRKSSPLDDDCVVLDHDPGKPMEVRNDNQIAIRENDDDDSDDLLIVNETGQVACRDYPHPRHLCIKFPFSSTPKETHCDQCYCYVCDSIAPCLNWGNGSANLDHCHATEKIEFWKLERQNFKNGNKVINIQPRLPPMNIVPPPPLPPPPLLVQTQSPVPRPNPIRVCPVPNINQNRTPYLLSRNKYQPGLVSQQLIRTSRGHMHHNYNLGGPFNRPVFKRTVSPAPIANRFSYNLVNNSGSFPNHTPYNLPFEEPFLSHEISSPPSSTAPFEFQVNVGAPVPFQPQLQPPLPNYSSPCEASLQGNQGQRSTIDSRFFNDIGWPENQTNHLPAGGGPANEPPVAAVSGGLVDCQYDNWMYDTQSAMEIPPGSLGLNEFSPEPGFLDSGEFISQSSGYLDVKKNWS